MIKVGESVSGKFLRTKDGVDLYYETYPGEVGKPTLFFLHGIGGDLDAWQYVWEKMAPKGYSGVAMDLRGHGYSAHPRPMSDYAIGNLVDDARAVMDAEKIEKVVMVGHCYGAVVGILCALAYPERIEKLVIASGTYRPHIPFSNTRITRGVSSFFASLGAFFSPKPLAPGHSVYPRGKFHNDYEWFGLARTMFRNSPRSYLSTVKQILALDISTRLKNITMPTLVMAGTRDTIFPVSIAEDIHREIRGSRFVHISEANHVIVLNNPNEVGQALEEFLTDHRS